RMAVDRLAQPLDLVDRPERVFESGVPCTGGDPVDNPELANPPQPLHQRRIQDEHLGWCEEGSTPDCVVDLLPRLVAERRESLDPLDVRLEPLFSPIHYRCPISSKAGR